MDGSRQHSQVDRATGWFVQRMEELAERCGEGGEGLRDSTAELHSDAADLHFRAAILHSRQCNSAAFPLQFYTDLPAELQDMVHLSEAGFTTAEMAVYYRCSQSTIRRELTKIFKNLT